MNITYITTPRGKYEFLDITLKVARELGYSLWYFYDAWAIVVRCGRVVAVWRNKK